MNFTFVRLYVYLTSACNFRCSHCFVSEKRKYIKPENIELSLIEKFVEDFGQNAKGVNLTGEGNPILHPQIGEILTLLKRMVGNVSINTRGWIQPKVFDLLDMLGVVVYYSVDWFGKRNDEWCGREGLWDAIVNTINMMAKRKMRFAIRTTIMRQNFGDCLQLIRMVEKLRMKGVDVVWEAMPYLPYHDEENMPTREQVKLIATVCLSKDFCRLLMPGWTCIFPTFRDRASRWWHKNDRLCEAGRPYGRIAIKQNGELLPCPFEMYVIGKYRKEYGEWVIDKEKVEVKLEKYLRMPVPTYCKDCPWVDVCGGGCRIMQNLTQDQPNCPFKELSGI